MMYIIKRGKLFRRNIVVIGDPIYFDETFKGEEGTQKANKIIREKMIECKNYKQK